MSDLIYMDYAATTPLKPEVLDAMMPYLTEEFGNASALYPIGRRAKVAVEEARKKIAAVIGAEPEEIYFTSGGTESDNWALTMTADIRKEKGRHIITTRLEHHAVLKTCAYLGAHGYDITYLPVPPSGIVDLDELRAAIRDDTILISVMTANNEIGTIQPIREIGEIAHEKGILFHTDAVQAFGHLPISVNDDHIDMLSSSAHKLGGPKGVGFMYLRKGVDIDPFMHGGQQERKHRAGTENVAGIVGFGKAAELALANLKSTMSEERRLRNQLTQRILSEIPGTKLNGDRKQRLTNNVNVQFEGVDAEQLLIQLGEKGICISGGSACASGSIKPSHVLAAIGCTHEQALESLRFTVGDRTTVQDVDFAVDTLKGLVAKLRSAGGTGPKTPASGAINWVVPC